MSGSDETREVARQALSGAWGAAAAALREDWEGFELLIGDGVRTSKDACAWAMAAVGGVNAILRHWDIPAFEWGTTVQCASEGRIEEAVQRLEDQIRRHGSGAVVGRTVGQLAAAVRVASHYLDEDAELLVQRLCLDAQVM